MIHQQYLEKPAFITKEERVTYSQLFKQINSYANLFSKRIKVAIFSENRLEWAYAFYAAWQNESIVVPIDFMSSVNDVAFILNDCKPEVIFTSNEKIEATNKILPLLNYSPTIFNFDTQEITLSNSDYKYQMPENIEDTALIVYTSGTTGSPKGVMLSYKNILVNLEAVCKEYKIYKAEGQILMLLPLHHIFSLLGNLVAPLFIGGTIVVCPSMQTNDLMDTFKNNNIYLMTGVPRLFELIYKGIKTQIDANFFARVMYQIVKLSKSQTLAKKIFKKVHDKFGGSLEIVVSGGAKLPKHIGSFFYTLGFKILEGYGMTETAPMITFSRPDNILIGSPGQKLSAIEVKIEEGEICVKGDNVMKGYYKRPEETADIIKNGWLHTGDLGYFDKKGFLHITGRKKEIIVLSNGKNINPIELEIGLEKHSPLISEVAVLMHENQLHALIVLDKETTKNQSLEDIKSLFVNTLIPEYNKNLSSYKRIMKFSLIEEAIPRTQLGKIQRFKLEKLIYQRIEKNKNTSDKINLEEYEVIKSFIEKQVDMDIMPNHHLEFDLALDSLGKVGLIEFIDRTFGVKIAEDALTNFPSIKKMVEFIAENKLRMKVENLNWGEILKEKVQLKLPRAGFTNRIITESTRNFFKLYFKMKSSGVKNIPEGACILAPNHTSYFDALFVTSFLKRKTIKSTYFYAKKKHVNNFFMKFLAKRNNVIVMDINNNLKESIQKLAEVLKLGKKIMIFPEGTRSVNGMLGDFKETFAILSKELNVPIIPVSIQGAYSALPRGKYFPKLRANVNVDFLHPVYPKNMNYNLLANKVKEKIKNYTTSKNKVAKI